MRSIGGERDPLEKPWVRRALQEDLAKGGMTQAKLAKKYNVTPPSITAFKQRHAGTIQAIIDDAGDRFAGILLAQQATRIETLAGIVEGFAESADPKAARLAVQALRNIAEELGHLPGRVTVSGDINTTTKYTFEGVDPSDLQ